MLVWFVKAHAFGVCVLWEADEVLVDLTGDVWLKPAHRFGLGEPFVSSPGKVRAGAWVPAQSGQGDGVQCGVGCSVSAAV